MSRTRLRLELETPFGHVAIAEDTKTGAVFYVQGDIHQSEADSDGVSLAPYIHAMFSMVVQSGARSALLVGCGGGTLGTMLVRQGVAVTMVDINPFSFDLAERYFHLDPRVKRIVADIHQVLERRRPVYDAIVLDAYHDNALDLGFMSPRFLEALRQRAAKRRGLLVANVLVCNDRDKTARLFKHIAAEAWGSARLLDRPGKKRRNALVLAGAVDDLQPPELLMSPALRIKKITRKLGQMEFVE